MLRSPIGLDQTLTYLLPMLRVKLFGRPQIVLNRYRLTELLNTQSMALFTYLIMAEKSLKRTTLIRTFWPNLPLWRARLNLHSQVYRLQWLMGNYIVSTRTQITFNHKIAYWLDVKTFAELINAVHARSISTTYTGKHIEPAPTPLVLEVNILYQLLGLYQAEFMVGFELNDAPLYTEWIMNQRDTLQTLAERLSCQTKRLS